MSADRSRVVRKHLTSWPARYWSACVHAFDFRSRREIGCVSAFDRAVPAVENGGSHLLHVSRRRRRRDVAITVSAVMAQPRHDEELCSWAKPWSPRFTAREATAMRKKMAHPTSLREPTRRWAM